MTYKETMNSYINEVMEMKYREVPEFVSDFFDRYKSAVTKRAYFSYIKDLLLWLVEQKIINKDDISLIEPNDMQNIKCKHIVKYFDDLMYGKTRRINSRETIKTKSLIFHTFFKYLKRKGYVSINIMEDFSEDGKKFKPDKTKKEVSVPTAEELNNFFENVKVGNKNMFNTIRNEAIVYLFKDSGIRLAELINLNLDDFLMDEDMNYYVSVTPKGNTKESRIVYITPIAAEHINKYLVLRKNFAKTRTVDENALFVSNGGTRMGRTAIQSFFDKYSNGKIHPHMLRHYCGTKLYDSTNDILLVKEQLGHSSSSTTEKFYISTNREKLAMVMNNCKTL